MPQPTAAPVIVSDSLDLIVGGTPVTRLSAKGAITLAESLVKAGFRQMMIDESLIVGSNRDVPSAGRRRRGR